jgi:hypothetical protein
VPDSIRFVFQMVGFGSATDHFSGKPDRWTGAVPVLRRRFRTANLNSGLMHDSGDHTFDHVIDPENLGS